MSVAANGSSARRLEPSSRSKFTNADGLTEPRWAATGLGVRLRPAHRPNGVALRGSRQILKLVMANSTREWSWLGRPTPVLAWHSEVSPGVGGRRSGQEGNLGRRGAPERVQGTASGGKREPARYSRHAKATFRKDRRLNIRLSSKDLVAIQKRALAEGLPYQPLAAWQRRSLIVRPVLASSE
jgi:hypothetical protein